MARDRSRGSGKDARTSEPRAPHPRRRATGDADHRHLAGTPQRPRPPGEPSRAHRTEGPSASPRKDGGRLALFGTHAVREALRCRRRKIFQVFATPEQAGKLAAEIAAAGLEAQIVEPKDLAQRLGPNAVHQGILVEAGPLPRIDLEDISSRSGLVLVLDQITDPHNVGAILRTAAAFGVDALVTTERHMPELSGTVAKAASGGLEHVPVVTVVNLARALEELFRLGYLRIGLDSEAGSSLAEIDPARPVALVLGGEGKGLRRLTREKCDRLARLDMPGPIKSLNVSNACAMALALLQSRPKA